MSLPLRVLGDRVLVRPDVQANAPEQTAGGIFMAKSLTAAVTGDDPTRSLHRGTVMAVGRPRHPLRAEAESLSLTLRLYADPNETSGRAGMMRDASVLLLDLIRREPCVAIGDDVLFSHDAGLEITLEDEAYVILREEELLAIVLPEATQHDGQPAPFTRPFRLLDEEDNEIARGFI